MSRLAGILAASECYAGPCRLNQPAVRALLDRSAGRRCRYPIRPRPPSPALVSTPPVSPAPVSIMHPALQPPAARSWPGWRRVHASLAERMPRWRLPLVTYATCQIIFLFWGAGFYPGLMNRDSITYVVHVTSGPWVNNHSVLYDSLVWLSLHTTGDLGALTLAQTIAMSAALAYSVAAFRRLGVPGRPVAVAAVVVAALPPLGSFVIFIWKDVPFSICAYLVVPTVAHLLSLRQGPGWPARPQGDDHPGSHRSGRRVTWLIAALPGLRSRLAATAAAVLCAAFVLNFFVYPAVGIRPMPSSLALGPVYAD